MIANLIPVIRLTWWTVRYWYTIPYLTTNFSCNIAIRILTTVKLQFKYNRIYLLQYSVPISPMAISLEMNVLPCKGQLLNWLTL